MVVYIEACESGSMLQKLPLDWNIFGTTAATANESSYACYWDEFLGVYLGDEYSVSWMEDTDTDLLHNPASPESLQTQFMNVKHNVNKSHPQEFGSKRISAEDIKNFQTEDQHTFKEDVKLLMESYKKRFLHS